METDYKKILVKFYGSENRMPTYTEMMKLFNFKSKNAVSRIVDKLIDAGLISKDPLGRIVPNASLTETPLVGLVKAGFPSPSEDLMETTINIDNYLIKKKGFRLKQ